MKKKFCAYRESKNLDLPAIEKEIISKWRQNNTFEKSISQREKSNHSRKDDFVFYDGPPFANGLPHYGHLLTGYIKDSYGRYQTIIGKRVKRRFGWDCHGLPAEMQVEKEIGVSGKLEIKKYGIDKFNKHCKDSVLKYCEYWKEYVNRQGRWVDIENAYRTMDMNFMESVLWAFKTLYEKGYIYKDFRVMPYSWACQTPLSHFETRMDNSYRQRTDKAVTVAFDLIEKPLGVNINAEKYRILAWTTTPWTLPSNLALAINTRIKYCAGLSKGDCLIFSKESIDRLGISFDYIEELDDANILIGKSYKPIFNYFFDKSGAFKIFDADFVVEGSGTGVVHIAPGFGEDDYNLCVKNGIDVVCPVDDAGCFTNEVSDFVGQMVFDANESIIIKLKNLKNWIKTEQYIHSYPHCWRTDTPLIYKALPSWYLKVTAIKDRMLELNKQINWIPYHIRDGIFHNWLAQSRDWAISRNRFWGCPIPVWVSSDPNYPRIDVYGSIQELERDFNVKIESLHKPFIDSLTRKNPDDPTGNSVMKRVEEVLDCWFESGSMPYAQIHYPFENKEEFEANLPADFIVEYVSQTRGWFYTLMVLSTALFDKPPFLNCICHGVILDTNGQKLSKRLGNYQDPAEIFELYGSDSLRFMMLSSGVTSGSELLIDKDGKSVYDALRLDIKPLLNAYNFFVMYANSDKINGEICFYSSCSLDNYILSKLKKCVMQIRLCMDSFDTQSACKFFRDFLDTLNNWYIRRSRGKFWKSEIDQEKLDAYNTLYTCIRIICVASSPLLPFLSDWIYQNLSDGGDVHLQDWPDVSLINENQFLIEEMDHAIDICSNILHLRNINNIRIRQPLSLVKIIMDGNFNDEIINIIKEEINVKNIIFDSDINNVADMKISFNLPNIAKRIPNKVQDIIRAYKSGSDWFIDKEKIVISGIELYKEEFEVVFQPKDPKNTVITKNGSGAILDLDVSRDLYVEGIARDIVRNIQQIRKTLNFNINDRIIIKIEPIDDDVKDSIDRYRSFICSQVLADFGDFSSGYESELKDIGKLVIKNG